MGQPKLTITYHAPVCPISRDQAVPGMPGRFVPVAPRAFDLPSAIAAANQLIAALMPQMGLNSSVNNKVSQSDKFSPGPGKSPKQDDGSGLPKRKRRWDEKERRLCKIKYYAMTDDNKRDLDNWIVMERFTYLRWHDKVQKVDLEFDWGYDPGDPYEDNSEFISGDKGRSEEEKAIARDDND